MATLWSIYKVLLLLPIVLGYYYLTIPATNPWWHNWVPLEILNGSCVHDSTYCGLQGDLYLLTIFTLPALLMAVFASIYLHFRNNRSGNGSAERKRLAAWRRPMVLKGLIVVSAMELVFLSIFLLLLLWCFFSYLTDDFREVDKGTTVIDDDDPKIWVQKLRSCGFHLGVVGNIACALLFYPVTRGSSVLPLIGLTSPGSSQYHVWVGHITMTLFTAHGLIYLLCWAITNNLVETTLNWDNMSTGISNVGGEIALFFGIVLWVTAVPRLRRQNFELFFYGHQLYVPFMFFYMMHVDFRSFTIVLPGFYLFLIDRYLRFLQSRRTVRLVSARLLPCDALELNFSKSPGLNFTPTSIVFINVPSISSLQWHPFTVTSNCNLEPDTLSVVITKAGNWTGKLHETLASPCPLDRLEVAVEGPYGPSTSAHFLRHDSLVMVAGGSGITPMISIIRELIFRELMSSGNRRPTPRNVTLICAFKHRAHLTMLELLLPISTTPGVLLPILSNINAGLQLEIKAFVTREINSNATTTLVRTIWFKPNPRDVPISAVLGPHSWLWLATIISASFVLFLILKGIIIGRFSNASEEQYYSTSSWKVVVMLVLCLTAGLVIASIAALWSKRQNDKQGEEQNQPTTHHHGTEAKSFPHRHLLNPNTQVRFGSRPDLKKMLVEYEGSSTGVLVNGPPDMRHEVAAICFSNSSGNLHYEAVSFNW